MPTNLEEAARQQVAVFLPDILQKVLKSYQDFMNQEISTDEPGKFSEHHKAGKVAISHVELLLKLIRLEQIGQNSSENDDIALLIETAKENLAAYHKSQDSFTSDNHELA